jgi:hypothetical protein
MILYSSKQILVPSLYKLTSYQKKKRYHYIGLNFRAFALQESVIFASDKSNAINTIYISRLMLKVFSIRKLMQSADVNTLDGDNQLHLIFYLHQYFIISGKTDARFIVIFICSLK